MASTILLVRRDGPVPVVTRTAAVAVERRGVEYLILAYKFFQIAGLVYAINRLTNG